MKFGSLGARTIRDQVLDCLHQSDVDPSGNTLFQDPYEQAPPEGKDFVIAMNPVKGADALKNKTE
ncbi:hypothetical protein N7478_009101 [Penicillium angulare]|uniref:uncharacterized protein n=1 Tax=Penicillium angulare TaxID=116970 RepID=UPI002541660A|nr:uncharacterized protein N7478_009101 [Penicillium angulare]KAJ5273976.1 hypothetical protein N7478_009101 [Penicillium angulare]